MAKHTVAQIKELLETYGLYWRSQSNETRFIEVLHQLNKPTNHYTNQGKVEALLDTIFGISSRGQVLIKDMEKFKEEIGMKKTNSNVPAWAADFLEVYNEPFEQKIQFQTITTREIRHTLKQAYEEKKITLNDLNATAKKEIRLLEKFNPDKFQQALQAETQLFLVNTIEELATCQEGISQLEEKIMDILWDAVREPDYSEVSNKGFRLKKTSII